MSWPYEEILSGEVWIRFPPGKRHETICARLHREMEKCLTSSVRLLPAREVVQVRTGTLIRPDLSLIDVESGRLWLAVEVVNSEDHRPDTVVKKSLYEEIGLPRLWIVDPRYDNVEVYESGEFGLALKAILACDELLTENGLPLFRMRIAELFGD